VAAGGMVIGSLLPQWITHPQTIDAPVGHSSLTDPAK